MEIREKLNVTDDLTGKTITEINDKIDNQVE